MLVEGKHIDLMPYLEEHLPEHFAFVSNHVIQIVQFPRMHIEEWSEILKKAREELR